MKTRTVEIFNHDADMDVTHKINSIELEDWINHLKYADKELLNLVRLCEEGLSIKLEGTSILKRFLKKREENETLLNALQKYSNSRSGIAECEDTQCDIVFITEHETYRRSYLYHLDKYRKLKDEFYNKAQGKFSRLKVT